jgi:hypothetical protein
MTYDSMSNETVTGDFRRIFEYSHATQYSRRVAEIRKRQRSGVLMKLVYSEDETPTYALWYNAKG